MGVRIGITASIFTALVTEALAGVPAIVSLGCQISCPFSFDKGEVSMGSSSSDNSFQQSRRGNRCTFSKFLSCNLLSFLPPPRHLSSPRVIPHGSIIASGPRCHRAHIHQPTLVTQVECIGSVARQLTAWRAWPVILADDLPVHALHTRGNK